jgi:hypothetical protein
MIGGTHGLAGVLDKPEAILADLGEGIKVGSGSEHVRA